MCVHSRLRPPGCAHLRPPCCTRLRPPCCCRSAALLRRAACPAVASRGACSPPAPSQLLERVCALPCTIHRGVQELSQWRERHRLRPHAQGRGERGGGEWGAGGLRRRCKGLCRSPGVRPQATPGPALTRCGWRPLTPLPRALAGAAGAGAGRAAVSRRPGARVARECAPAVEPGRGAGGQAAAVGGTAAGARGRPWVGTGWRRPGPGLVPPVPLPAWCPPPQLPAASTPPACCSYSLPFMCCLADRGGHRGLWHGHQPPPRWVCGSCCAGNAPGPWWAGAAGAACGIRHRSLAPPRRRSALCHPSHHQQEPDELLPGKELLVGGWGSGRSKRGTPASSSMRLSVRTHTAALMSSAGVGARGAGRPGRPLPPLLQLPRLPAAGERGRGTERWRQAG